VTLTIVDFEPHLTADRELLCEILGPSNPAQHSLPTSIKGRR
jgi:hypothetical protein